MILNGLSELALHHGLINGVAMTGGPINLTDAQALDATPAALALLPANSLVVTGVAAGDVANVAAIAALFTMAVSDDQRVDP